MTQTPPSGGGPSMLAPAPGIPGTPVQVVVGTAVQIKLPTQSPIGGSPIPMTFPWVVLLNASPYTVIVSTGAATIQIAAFNSDKVYIYPGGGPNLSVLAVAGAGTPVPGSDTTVYSTFYHDEPPGQFPAYIGPGAAVPLSGAPIVNNSPGTAIGGSTAVTFPSSGSFSSAGYSSLEILLSCGATPANLFMAVTWGNFVRRVTIGAGAQGMFSLPHMGPTFTISLFNNNVGAGTYGLIVQQSTVPATVAWQNPGSEPALILPTNTASAAGSGGLITAISKVLWPGPAQVVVNPVAKTWSMLVRAINDQTHTYDQLVLALTNGGQVPNGGGIVPVTLPYANVAVSFTNSDGIARTPQFTIIGDDARVGA